MRQSLESKETYLLLSQVSKLTTIPKATIYKFAVKSKTRFYRFSGRRWIEKKDLICVLQLLKSSRTELEKISIDSYLETLL